MNDFARYHRQMLLQGIGEAGQHRLRDSHALVVGCGALGSIISDLLARAGVGTLTIVDRDIVELTNLQRQILFDEDDVREGLPKAEAARRKIAKINSQVTVHAHVDDFSHRNAEHYANGADIIVDGLDNLETRYLLNDLSIALGLPYVYGGAVGTSGMSFPILPHPAHRRSAAPTSKITWEESQSTPCLRCVFPQAPPPGTTPTCDTVGVLGSVVMMIASHQVTQAIKLMVGAIDALDTQMLSIDVWQNELRRFSIDAAREADRCPCCGRGEFAYLDGAAGSTTTSLCGRNAVQITPANGSLREVDLATMAQRLAAHGSFQCNEHLLRGRLDHERGADGEPMELTVFPNGRAIIKGTTEPDQARSIYAKYLGS